MAILRRVETARGEPIRRLPVTLARWLNSIIRWTPDLCAGGCGYPVTYRFTHEVEEIDGVRVLAALCSIGGGCEQRIEDGPKDELGRTYAEYRPEILQFIQDEPRLDIVRLTHNA